MVEKVHFTITKQNVSLLSGSVCSNWELDLNLEEVGNSGGKGSSGGKGMVEKEVWWNLQVEFNPVNPKMDVLVKELKKLQLDLNLQQRTMKNLQKKK